MENFIFCKVCGGNIYMQNAEVKIKIFGKILYTSDKDE